MRYFAVLRTTCAVVAACLFPLVAQSQKALVYCPVDIDDVGCRNIATAIAGRYPGGVHSGYDGTAGTVDLRVADLSGYSVFIVPSLADDAELKPYALLRDAVVAGRLRTALTGRITMWSGTPDLGTAESPNRTQKNQLMVNLAAWAGGNFSAAKGPGLLTFLDQSNPETDRYGWVALLTGRTVVADPALVSYASAKALTPAAVSIIGTGGTVLTYPNLASFGFQLPAGAPGIAIDAVGQTGSTVRGQVVLLTSAGGKTAGAVVQTDETFYAPGTTVVVTGSGWLPGETVTLLFHEEVPIHADRSFTTVADGTGSIAFSGFAPEAHEVDIRFILTATGASSQLRTQTSFLEGTSFTASATGHNGAGSELLTLSKPGGVVAGDVLLAQVSFLGGADITAAAPAGWALVRREQSGSALGQAVYSKVATATEPASYAWSFSGAIKAAGGIARYSNVTLAADGNPVVAHAASSGGAPGTATSLVAPSVSTTGSTMVVTFFATGANTTLSTPSSMTLRHQLPNPQGSDGPTIMGSDIESSASETGTHTATAPASGAWVAHTIALDFRQIGQGSGGRMELPVTRPAGVRDGDFLLANIAYTGSSLVRVTPPAGWTLIATRSNTAPLTQATYWRVAGASDRLDVWTFDREIKSVGVITAYRDIDIAGPVDVVGTNPTSNGNVSFTTNLVAPTVTTTTPGALVVALYAGNQATHIVTPPAGMRLRYSIGVHDPFSPATITIAAAEATQDPVGPTGVKTAVSAVAVHPVAQTLVLRRRPAAPPATKLAFTTASRTGLINECLGPITIQVQDETGTPANVTTATALTLSTDGAGGFFTASGCGAPAPTSITVGAGANAASVYYRATARGTGAHRVTASATGLASASQLQTIEATISPTLVASVTASPSTFGGTTDLSATVTPAVPGSVTFFVGGSVTPVSASYDAATGVATAGGITHGLGASGSAYGVRAVFAPADDAYAGSEATNADALAVGQASQVISFDLASVTATYGDAAFPLAAFATGGASGNPISFSGETPATCGVTPAGQVTITAAGLCTLTASQAGNTNYAAAAPLSRSFTIATRALTVTAAGVDKVYDGTTATTVILADDRVAGDALTIAYQSAAFADKGVGTGKAIAVNGITISGTAAANYTSSTTATATADITPRALAVTATGADREYDGTSAAAVTLADDRLDGDVFSTSYADAAFADGNVGTGKSITVTGIAISGTDAGNYLANATATASAGIRARAVTAAISAADKVYDGSTAAIVSTQSLTGLLAGDAVTLAIADARFDDRTVGSRTVTATIGLAGTAAGNYALAATTATAPAAITPKALTGSFSTSSKVYDGTTTAHVAASSLAGVVAGDAVGLEVAQALFDTRHVGTAKPVTATLNLTGADLRNYTVNPTATATANISPRALVISATGVDKVYDGSPAASATLSDDRLTGDALTTSYAVASFSDHSVGAARPMTVSGISVTGADANNYSFNTTATTSARIAALALTGSIVADDKVYDGSTAAVAAGQPLSGLVAGDAVALSVSNARFDSRNVGVRTVTADMSLTGAAAGNYVIGATTATTTASITAKALVGSFTADSRIYDGTTAATVAATALPGVVGGDAVSLEVSSATFDDKHAGNAKRVTANLALSGADIGNYTVNATGTATASVTARTLTVSALGESKLYDGTPTAAATLSDDRIAGDVLTAAYASATFADANVGTRKPMTVSGISLSGADAGNYTFNTTATTNADISARSITVKATSQAKVYGDADPELTYEVTSGSLVAGDRFAGKLDRAAGETVSGSPYAIRQGTLTAGPNYALTLSGADLTVTRRPVVAIVLAGNKEYDGGVAATIAGSTLGNGIAEDEVGVVAGTASFADKHVGTGKPVTVTGLALVGTQAGNYALSSTTAVATADIVARPLMVTAVGHDRIYDGSSGASVTLSDDRIAGDVLTAGYSSATFADAGAGAGKPITVSGISLSGADASNYAASATASASATILPRPIAVSVDAKTKVYGDPDPALSYQVTSGALVTGDRFVGELTRVAGETVAGSPYAIQQGTLSAGTNYQLMFSGAGLDVTRRAVTPTITVAGKVYDGGVTATIAGSTMAGAIAGDAISVGGGTATFADRNAGAGKVVTATGLTLVGAQAGNYALSSSTAVTTADIAPRPLSVTASASSKMYDGSASASVTLADDRIGGDALTTQFASAAFSDKHVGSTKTVTVNGISVGGPDQGNYTFNTAAATTAAITARPLIISASGMNKVYDGTTAATVTLTDNRVSGDALTAAYASASFSNPDAGTGKAVAVNGITLSGADALNYAFNTSAATTADITPLSAEIVLGNLSQRWDGTAKAPTATTSPSGLAVTYVYTQNGVTVATPTDAGIYDVLATITGPNHVGTATGTLVILNLIDIMPGNSLNVISIGDTKTTEIVVAILGTATFDARTVVPSSVTLGDGIGTDAPVNTSSTGALRASIADANGDGRADLVVYFKKTTVISLGNVTTATKELVIRGSRTNGLLIRGTDKVTVYP